MLRPLQCSLLLVQVLFWALNDKDHSRLCCKELVHLPHLTLFLGHLSFPRCLLIFSHSYNPFQCPWLSRKHQLQTLEHKYFLKINFKIFCKTDSSIILQNNFHDPSGYGISPLGFFLLSEIEIKWKVQQEKVQEASIPTVCEFESKNVGNQVLEQTISFPFSVLVLSGFTCFILIFCATTN